MVPYSTVYGLQFLLTQSGVHCILVFQLLNLISPSWLGHAVESSASQSGKQLHSCTFLAQFIPKAEYYNCAVCRVQVPQLALNCVGCNTKVHVDCFPGQTPDLSIASPGISSFVSLSGGEDFIRVSLFQTQLCAKCQAPLWGTCLQALQSKSSGELFHPFCVSHQLGQTQQPIPLDVADWLGRQHAIDALEYSIFHDWMKMQLAMAQASPHSQAKAEIKRALDMLETRRPASAMKPSPLFNFSQLAKISSYLGESDTKKPHWGLVSIVSKLQSRLALHSNAAARILLQHVVAHGLAAFVVEKDGIHVLAPFATINHDFDINFRAADQCFKNKDLHINEYGFMLVRRLLPIAWETFPRRDRLLQLEMAWAMREDSQSTAHPSSMGQTRRHLITRYLLPDLAAAQAQMGGMSLAVHLFPQLSLHSETPSMKQCEADLELILRCQAAGFPEELVCDFLDQWAIPFLASIENLPLHLDPTQLVWDLLVERLPGIIYEEGSLGLSAVIDDESFLYKRALHTLRASPSNLASSLAWLRLLSIAQIVIPDALDLLEEFLGHASLDAKQAAQALAFVFHQMSLSLRHPLQPCSKLISKLSAATMLDWLGDSHACQDLVAQAVAIALLEAGHNPIAIESFTLPLPSLRIMPQITFTLTPLLSGNTAASQLLVSLVLVCAPSKVHLVLQSLRLVCASERPAFLSDRALIHRLWELLDPAYGVEDAIVSELLFDVGGASPQFLLSCTCLDGDASFAKQWAWLDCVFGFLSRLTPATARLYPDAWQFIGPYFDCFTSFTLSKEEPLRTKVETLMQAFDTAVLRNLLQFWEIYFDASSIDKRIVTCRQMIKLNLLFPHWAVANWRSLIGLLSLTINQARTQELLTLKVLAFQLCFQMLANGIAIVKREFFTIMYLMAKLLGFSHATLEIQEGTYWVNLKEFNSDYQGHQVLLHAFFSQLKVLLDEPAIMHDDRMFSDEAESLDPDPQCSTKQLLGVQFMDLFFRLGSSCLENPISTGFLSEIIECSMVFIYKYPIDPQPIQDLVVIYIEHLCRLLPTTLSENLTLAILNLFYITLQRVPKITKHTLSTQVLAVINLIDQCAWNEGEPVVLKAHCFLLAVFHAYSSNGIYILILKNYDYDKSKDALFKVLAQVLKDDMHGMQLKPMKLPNRKTVQVPMEQPIFDVMQRLLSLPLENSAVFNKVLTNTYQYILKVYHTGFSEVLLFEYFTVFLPKFARHVADWAPSSLDLTSILSMTALILWHHTFVAELVLNNVKHLLKTIIGRFPFQPHALSQLLESIVRSYSGKEDLEDSVDFGTIILEEFASALVRLKPAFRSDQMVSLCQVIFYGTWPTPLSDDHFAEVTPNPAEVSFEELRELTQIPKLFLVFQEIPVYLFTNLIDYLDDPSNFSTPQSLRAGIWGGYLLAALYVLHEIPASTVHLWIESVTPRRGLLTLCWFLMMLTNIENRDNRETLAVLQPSIVELINQGFPSSLPSETLPYTIDDSSSLNLTSHSGLGLMVSQSLVPHLTLAVIKIWASIFSRMSFAAQGQPPDDNAFDDPFFCTSLQSSFWMSIWPTLLSAISVGAYTAPESGLNFHPSLTIPFCKLIVFLAQSMAYIPSPGFLAPEWLCLLNDLATVDPKLPSNQQFRLARALLLNDAISLPYSPIQITQALFKELQETLISRPQLPRPI
ncbi:hypothetical protein DSO57_1020543 [Entomophthora muscae]|uniref:Uncharacterized protein n=1 Tax=Entomophthora muscae TaxID=34485 RepID=A0ACC2RV18_9FUNG|nr:hypothetical protein DSO57_1020543 [Entomophthora muscae]